MEETECSETSVHRTRTPGNPPPKANNTTSIYYYVVLRKLQPQIEIQHWTEDMDWIRLSQDGIP